MVNSSVGSIPGVVTLVRRNRAGKRVEVGIEGRTDRMEVELLAVDLRHLRVRLR